MPDILINVDTLCHYRRYADHITVTFIPATIDNKHTQEKAHALRELGEIQKVLRRIPAIELNTPTVVLVGAPNVGKSSIVRAVSTGTPEVVYTHCSMHCSANYDCRCPTGA